MARFNVFTLKACEACEGTGQQIQDEGLLMGMLRPCPLCGWDYKKFINQYGSDGEEHPMIYIDLSAGISAKVCPGQKTVIINNKEYIL